MKVRITVQKSEKRNKLGELPIIFTINNTVSGKRTKSRLRSPFYSHEDHWDFDNDKPKRSHAKFNTINPFVLEKKLQIDEIYKKGITDLNQIKSILKNKFEYNSRNVIEFGYNYSKQKGTATKGMYETALNELQAVYPTLNYDQFTYKTLIFFKNHLKNKGLKNSTIHTYLSKLRSVYNEFCRINNVDNRKPFQNVFSGLNSRSFTNKRNYLSKKQIKRLRRADLSGVKKTARDLFLLQFYLGGQDLKDIVFLKKTDLYKNRMYFNRSKLNSGYELSNKVFSEARTIIDQYKCNNEKNEYLFDFRTDDKGYKTFRRRIQKALIEIQIKLEIELPNYGNLGIKTARHSFANFGKMLFVHEDILREIQGHERKDIDNYYKDLYPNKVRDKYHRKIIDKVYSKKELAFRSNQI